MAQKLERTTPGAAGWLAELTSLERRTLGICFGGWMLDQFDVQIFSFLVPTLMGLWKISPGQAGSLGTVTLIISALGGWIAGALADRHGRVRVLQVTIAWYALFTFLCGFAQNFEQLFAFRALQGFGFGGEWGVGAVLIGEIIRDRYRGRAVGLVQSGASVGWGLAGVAYIALFAFVPEWLAWRVLFWLGVLPGVLVFYVRRYVPEPARRADAAAAGALTQMFAVLKPPYFSMTARVSLMVIGAQGGFYALNFWLPTYLKTVRNISSVGAGSYVLVTIAGAFCGFLLGAFLGDAIGRKPTFLLSAGASLVMVVVYLFAPLDNIWILPVGFLLGVASLTMFGPMGAFMTELYPATVRATGQGFCYNAGRGIGALFPGLVGLLTAGLGLGKAIGLFTVGAYALMFLVLLTLPETRGRDLAALDAQDGTHLRGNAP